MLRVTLLLLARELMGGVDDSKPGERGCAREEHVRLLCKLALLCESNPARGRAVWRQILSDPAPDPISPATGGSI
jgi:hypothetical protein